MQEEILKKQLVEEQPAKERKCLADTPIRSFRFLHGAENYLANYKRKEKKCLTH